MIYNFNICPRNGKTYFDQNNNWKHLKKRIKDILDSKDSSRLHKIDLILVMVEDYKRRYYPGESKPDYSVMGQGGFTHE